MVPRETRLRLGKHRDSRENKTDCFPRDHTLTVYNIDHRPSLANLFDRDMKSFFCLKYTSATQ